MKKLSIATGVIKHNGKYLIARRLEPEWLKGFWEFPGGTIEENETVHETLVREIKEETNLDVKPVNDLFTFTETVKDRSITIHFVDSEIIGDVDVKLDEHDEYAWVDETTWKNYKWTSLTGVYADMLFNKK